MKILSQGKFRKFEGFICQGMSEELYRVTVNGSDIKATKDHQFLIDGEWISVEDIANKEQISNEIVYDAFNVSETNSYTTNGVESHNCNLIYIDEFAHIENDVAFFESTYPTISSGKNTQVIITSTPKGLNLFYHLWSNAMEGRNEFKTLAYDWSVVPGRDEKWKEETIANTSPVQFAQEFECSFMGSSNTLLSGNTLQRLTFKEPIAYDYNERMRIYEQPVAGNYYVMAVDVAEGTGGDYSVVCVIDVTTMPYRQVAIYQHNLIQPIPFTQVVHDIGKRYNDAYAVVENNSIGKIVADSLFFDFEYESIFCTGQMFDAQNLGVRTTKKVKALGCSNLKAMIEGNRLLITDFSTVSELSTFSATRTGSYAAEKGKHDDTVMPLVIFAYVTSLDYFQDITNIDFRSNIRQAFEESDNLSCMFVDDGLSDYE